MTHRSAILLLMSSTKPRTYDPRIIDTALQERLESVGAVVIEGAKGVGKTATASQAANSAVHLDTDIQAQQLVEIDPALVLDGKTPRLIDEWHIFPEIWNYVKREVDTRGSPGQFILTGSATPADDFTRHSGAGRFARLRQRPFTMLETGHSSGSTSLAALLQGEVMRTIEAKVDLSEVVQRLVRGGFPAALQLSDKATLQFNRDYLQQISRVDLRGNGQLVHDPHKVQQLIRSLARNTATEATIKTLVQDVMPDESPLARTTVERYLDTLRTIFLLEEQPAWSPNLRSKAILRKAPKLHLVDVALAIAALRADTTRLLSDPETLGLAFESFVFQQLLVYAEASAASVYHYRDSSGLEADAIIQIPDGSWIAIEVKLSPRHIDSAAENLKKLAETIAGSPPKSLVVVTATGYAYTRPDGVSVAPISTLGP